MSRNNSRGARDFVQDDYYSPSAIFNQTQGNAELMELANYQAMYRRYLTELCMNRFKWIGLPESVNVPFLERTLFRHGLSVFYRDMDFGGKFLSLRALKIGEPNYEDEYTEFQVYGNGGSFRPKNLKAVAWRERRGNSRDTLEFIRHDPECVPIWANYLRMPDAGIVQVFANRLANIDVSLDINSMNLRMPKVLSTDQDTKLTGININRLHDQGAPLIHVKMESDGQLSSALPTVLDVGADPDSIDALINLRDRVWSNCMMLLGINNGPAEKAERVQTAEVEANNEQVASGKHIALNSRKIAAHKINRLFPELNVSIEYQVDIDKQLDDIFDASLDGTETDGV